MAVAVARGRAPSGRCGRCRPRASGAARRRSARRSPRSARGRSRSTRRSASPSWTERSRVKAPRSRCDATSGAAPLANAVASSAQRASWKEWRTRSVGSARLVAARVGPCTLLQRLARLAARARTDLPWRRRRRRRAARAARPGGARPGRPGSGSPGARPRVGSAAAASPSSKASTTARSPIPKGARRSRMSSGARRPESVAARTSPESRRSVSLATRSRISSSATTIAACCTQSRSKSPELAGAPHHHEPGLGRAGPRRDRMGEGPAAQIGLVRHEGRRGGAARDAPRRGSRRAGTRAGGRPPLARTSPRRVEDDRASADRRGDLLRHLVEAATLQDQPLEALVDRDPAGEHVVLLVDQAAEGSLGDRDERGLVRDLEDREAGRLRLGERWPSGSSRDRTRCRSRDRRRPRRRAGG